MDLLSKIVCTWDIFWISDLGLVYNRHYIDYLMLSNYWIKGWYNFFEIKLFYYLLKKDKLARNKVHEHLHNMYILLQWLQEKHSKFYEILFSLMFPFPLISSENLRFRGNSSLSNRLNLHDIRSQIQVVSLFYWKQINLWAIKYIRGHTT